jgi:ParB/RepB/Spo0J family partition protein
MTSSFTPAGRRSVPLERIAIPGNVRDLDTEHVDALAKSIRLRGLLVPVIVRPTGDGYELVAGFHRFAAHQQFGAASIDAEVRDAGGEHGDRAVENIARKQLGPHEEARAVAAMLADGLTEDGAAEALGWPKARVTARVKLLELPERAQELVGAGAIALSAVDQLRAIGKVSPSLLDVLIEFLADGNEWAAERLAREPGWVLDAALRETDAKVFVAHLSAVADYEIAELKLAKKATEAYEKAAELHRQLDRYAYGGPRIRFTDAEVDQARAAGVTIEFERSAPLIVDRSLYRELVKQAIARTVSELEASVAERDAARKADRQTQGADRAADPLAEAEREERAQLRVAAEQAHGVNLDIGAGLMTGLATVDAADLTVARFFVYGLLGADYDDSPYTQTGERVSRLAMSGIRLVIDEFRSDVTETRKDGSRGKLRIDYGDPHQPGDAVKWLWKFVVCRADGYAEPAYRSVGVACSSRVVMATCSA